ncbi:MAG: SurA N-terminal domain-containing protein [Clostridia bacterium]|nr:SurA N-terminal domain-containing protein [Clostridia bacterium]
MKMITRLLALLMALMLCLPALAETTAEDVLATVNGTPVTRAEYEEYLNSMKEYYTTYGYDVNDATFVALLRQLAMKTAIEYKLMDQKIVEMNLAMTEEEKAAAAQTAKADWEAVINEGLTYYGITETSTEDERAAKLLQVLAELESMGYTEETYIEETVTYANYDKLYAEIIKTAEVTDEEVKAHFDSLVAADEVSYKGNAAAYEEVQYMNQMYAMYGMSDYVTDLYYVPEGYRGMSHILLSVEETVLTAYSDLQAKYEEQQSALEEGTEVTDTLVTAEEVEAARLAVIASVQTTIDEINAKLAAGESFASLIPQYSTDPGMTDAATIAEGYAVHMDSIMWDPAFRDASFTVDNVGDVTAPVVGSYGVHILQYVRDIPAGAVELTAELTETLRAELLSAERSTVYNSTLEAWMAEAEIVYSAEAQAFMSEESAEAAEETTEETAEETTEEAAEAAE